MENECYTIPSRFFWVSYTNASSPLKSMCESSANRCTAVSTSSVLWEARPGDGTLRICRQVYIVIVRNMLSYATAAWAPWLSATSTSKLGNVQLEAARAITGLVLYTPVEDVLAESQPSPISTRFLTISLIKADEWAYLPPVDERHQTLFTASR